MFKKYIPIILSILAVVLLLVGGFLIFFNKDEGNRKESFDKTSYDVSLVESEGFTLDAVPYNGDYEVALFIKSSKNYGFVNIDVSCYDSNESLIETKEYNNASVKADKRFLISMAVDLDKVKSIKVKVTPEGEADDSLVFLDSSKLNFTTDVNVLEKNNATISLTADNPYEQKINLVNGYVMFYSGDILVDTVNFGVIDVLQGAKIATTVNTILYDSTGVIEYDSVKVIVNELF